MRAAVMRDRQLIVADVPVPSRAPARSSSGRSRVASAGPISTRSSTINKELSLQSVLGYSAEEFASTLDHIAAGRIETQALVTGKVGVEGVAWAFEELASPERPAKILVEPWRP